MVLLATLLFTLVTALWTVAVPAYRPPDEAAHLDLVLYLAEGNPYPTFDGRYFGEAIGLDSERHLVDSQQPWPRFDADDAPPRGDRPDVDELGGTAPDANARPTDTGRADYPYLYNQMPQHPPLYYVGMAGLLRLERLVLPGEPPSLDQELGMLRLANVLLVAPLPLLAWAAVVRLGGDRRAGIVAALLPLGLPQLLHIGAAVNNDNLLLLLGGVLSVLLIGVARGRRSRRTDIAVGVVVGLAMLTKAFALMFIPWVVVAYALYAWTTGRRRASAVALLVSGTTAGLVGAWWWVANWLRVGEPAPTTENLTRTTDTQPPGFDPDPIEFLWSFTGRLTSRTWAWIGYRTPKFELPSLVVVALTLAVLVAVVVVGRRATPGAATSSGPRRVDVVFAWLPALLLVLFIARRAWGLYQTTGLLSFIQGRYLFAALAAPMAIVAIGAGRVLGRWAVCAALAVVVSLELWVLVDVIRGSWSGDGALGSLDGMLAWSPWPSAIVLALVLGALAVTGLLAAECRADTEPSSP